MALGKAFASVECFRQQHNCSLTPFFPCRETQSLSQSFCFVFLLSFFFIVVAFVRRVSLEGISCLIVIPFRWWVPSSSITMSGCGFPHTKQLTAKRERTKINKDRALVFSYSAAVCLFLQFREKSQIFSHFPSPHGFHFFFSFLCMFICSYFSKRGAKWKHEFCWEIEFSSLRCSDLKERVIILCC